MDHYIRGEVIESTQALPFVQLPDCIQIKIAPKSPISKVIGFAVNKFKDDSVTQISWSALGRAFGKAIACSNIIKRRFKQVYMEKFVYYKQIEEFWDHKIDGLSRLRTIKEVPAICILMSKEPIQSTDISFEQPEQLLNMLQTDTTKKATKNKEQNKGKKGKKARETTVDVQPPREAIIATVEAQPPREATVEEQQHRAAATAARYPFDINRPSCSHTAPIHMLPVVHSPSVFFPRRITAVYSPAVSPSFRPSASLFLAPQPQFHPSPHAQLSPRMAPPANQGFRFSSQWNTYTSRHLQPEFGRWEAHARLLAQQGKRKKRRPLRNPREGSSKFVSVIPEDRCTGGDTDEEGEKATDVATPEMPGGGKEE